MGAQPIGVAGAGPLAGHVEDVLGGKSQARKRTAIAGVPLDKRMNEGAQSADGRAAADERSEKVPPGDVVLRRAAGIGAVRGFHGLGWCGSSVEFRFKH